MSQPRVSQLGWTAPTRRCQVRYSTGPFWKRFSIAATSSGFTVADHEVGDLARVTTLAAARAWAGIRVNEQCVRHE